MTNSNLLIIGFVWPEPNSSAAGSRILQLITEFKKQGYSITFATTANVTDNTFDLHSVDVKTKQILLNDSSFDDFVKELNPDMVMFDRFMTEEQFGWRVAEQCPNAIRILDTEDFHGLRKGRGKALKKGVDFDLDHLQNDVTKREIASIYRCDLSLMISQMEIDILIDQLGVSPKLLYYLPFLISPTSDMEKSDLPSFEERQHFITIGNFLHPPNYDAVVYLKQTVWPLIRQKLPTAELHIYGAYESQKVKQLHDDKNGFLINGFAEDVYVVMQLSRICLAPLRFGAGLKGKIFDALQNGTPCVMSAIAAEGIYESNEKNNCITDDPLSFAETAVSLYNQKEFWIEAQDLGYNILSNRFNTDEHSKKFRMQIESLCNNLKLHRQRNFTGQVLMYHSLQSTKYMSKWIEEKNK